MSEGRGILTDKAKKMAKDFLGREILGTDELRFYPYIQYQMMNEQKLDPRVMNGEDRAIFAQLKKEGHVDGGMTGLRITKEFWDYINEILFVTYVAWREEAE